MTLSNGMPSSSATSRSPSFIRWMVVHADPRPRSRSASMKLHTAGSSDPQPDAPTRTEASSRRPQRHGITSSGTAVEVVGEVRRRVGDLGLALAAGVARRRSSAPGRCGTRRSSCGRRRRSPASWRRPRPRPSASPADCCPVGACMAMVRHSSTTARSTGRSKSSRLRTERVVVSSSSADRFNFMTPNLRLRSPATQAELAAHSLALARSHRNEWCTLDPDARPRQHRHRRRRRRRAPVPRRQAQRPRRSDVRGDRRRRRAAEGRGRACAPWCCRARERRSAPASTSRCSPGWPATRPTASATPGA